MKYAMNNTDYKRNAILKGAALLILIVALLPTAWGQTPTSPHDTIEGREITYIYQDWLDYGDPSISSLCSYPIIYGTWGHPCWYNYVDSATRILGIAVSTKIENFGQNPDDYDTVVLYKPTTTPGQWTELAAKRYELGEPSRWMLVTGTMPHTHTLGKCYLPIYEVYFDSAITVTDSFYAGAGVCNDYDMGWGNMDIQIGFWQGLYICKGAGYGTHYGQYDRYGHIAYVNTSWEYIPFIWPIIDTSGWNYIPPCDTMTCRLVDGLRVAIQAYDFADLTWVGSPEHEAWEVSWGPVGTTPGEGHIIQTSTTTATITNMDSTTHYVAYVRGHCTECDNWSDWSNGLEFYMGMNDPDDPDNPDNPEGITAVEQLSSIVPNPAHGKAQIVSEYHIHRLDIYNAQGLRTMSTEVDGKAINLDLQHFAPGTYLVNIRTSAGTVTKKLVVE